MNDRTGVTYVVKNLPRSITSMLIHAFMIRIQLAKDEDAVIRKLRIIGDEAEIVE